MGSFKLTDKCSDPRQCIGGGIALLYLPPMLSVASVTGGRRHLLDVVYDSRQTTLALGPAAHNISHVLLLTRV